MNSSLTTTFISQPDSKLESLYRIIVLKVTSMYQKTYSAGISKSSFETRTQSSIARKAGQYWVPPDGVISDTIFCKDRCALSDRDLLLK